MCRLHAEEVFLVFFFFFQAEDGIRDLTVTGVQTCALPILAPSRSRAASARVRHLRSRSRNRPIKRCNGVRDPRAAAPSVFHEALLVGWRRGYVSRFSSYPRTRPVSKERPADRNQPVCPSKSWSRRGGQRRRWTVPCTPLGQ